MTSGAFSGSTSVKGDGQSFNIHLLQVALAAGDRLVSPFQREPGVKIVIELGGDPVRIRMADFTGAYDSSNVKLARVRVLMAARADVRSLSEDNVFHLAC